MNAQANVIEPIANSDWNIIDGMSFSSIENWPKETIRAAAGLGALLSIFLPMFISCYMGKAMFVAMHLQGPGLANVALAGFLVGVISLSGTFIASRISLSLVFLSAVVSGTAIGMLMALL